MFTDIYMFDKWPIKKDTVFMSTKLSIGFVNLKPIVPGHVLLMPMRHVKVLFAYHCYVG